MSKEKPKKADPLFVPGVTPEQQQAAAALKAANEVAAAARQAASEATTVANALKKVAEQYAAFKKEADEEAGKAMKAVEEAVAAKRRADEDGLKVLEKAAAEDRKFLKSAFDFFDTEKSGLLSHAKMAEILVSLSLPSLNDDVDNCVQIMDRNGWMQLMSAEMKEALRKHPNAKEWSSN
jgi:hypothetical protein